jgi:hypothetical protein
MQTARQGQTGSTRRLAIVPETVSADTGPGGQRRAGVRFPIATDVAFQLIGRGSSHATGNGRSVNISSSGILVATKAPLPADAPIILQIAWPAKLNNTLALSLHVRGRTVRSDGNFTAVAFARHEFRTRRKSVTG